MLIMKSSMKQKILLEVAVISLKVFNLLIGNGTAVVFQTGDNTFFGKIASSTLKIERPPSLLTAEIFRLIVVLAYISFTLATIFLIVAICIGYSVSAAIVAFVGIVVGNVPEGLLP